MRFLVRQAISGIGERSVFPERIVQSGDTAGKKLFLYVIYNSLAKRTLLRGAKTTR